MTEMSEREARRIELMAQEFHDIRSKRVRMMNHIEIVTSDDYAPNLAKKDLREGDAPYPRFDIGLEHVDALGGGYGLTVCGARPGVGKSTLALGASLLSAACGQPTIYFDAENPVELQKRRALAWCGGDAQRLDSIIDSGLFQWVEVESGHSIRQIVQLILKEFSEQGALIVFDSLNSISRSLLKPGENYLQSVTKRAVWMNSVAKKTDGRVRFLALSELNKEGGIKGLEAEHVASMVIAMEREDPEDPQRIRVRVTKNRDGREDRKGQVYELQWQHSAFVRADVS